MGVCETLNPAGLGFLADLGAPFTDRKGNRLAPLGLALETYGRNPAGKHAVLEIFARREKSWLLTHTFIDEDEVNAPPFDQLTFSLGLLWPFDQPA